MSEKVSGPEAVVRDVLAMRIRQMDAAEEKVRNTEIILRAAKSTAVDRKNEAQRYYAALLVLVPSTEKEFDKYVREFKRANPS